MKFLIKQRTALTNASMKSSEISYVLIPPDTNKFCCCFQSKLILNVLNIVSRLTEISAQREIQMKNLIVENSRKISSVQVSFHLLSSASVYKLIQVTTTEENESQTAAETEKNWTEWRDVTESKSFIELFTQGSFESFPLDSSKTNFKTILSIKDEDVYVTVSNAIAVSVTMYKKLMHILLSEIIQQEIVHCINFRVK